MLIQSGERFKILVRFLLRKPMVGYYLWMLGAKSSIILYTAMPRRNHRNGAVVAADQALARRQLQIGPRCGRYFDPAVSCRQQD